VDPARFTLEHHVHSKRLMRRGTACGETIRGAAAVRAGSAHDDGKVLANYSLDVSDAF